VETPRADSHWMFGRGVKNLILTEKMWISTSAVACGLFRPVDVIGRRCGESIGERDRERERENPPVPRDGRKSWLADIRDGIREICLFEPQGESPAAKSSRTLAQLGMTASCDQNRCIYYSPKGPDTRYSTQAPATSVSRRSTV